MELRFPIRRWMYTFDSSNRFCACLGAKIPCYQGKGMLEWLNGMIIHKKGMMMMGLNL